MTNLTKPPSLNLSQGTKLNAFWSFILTFFKDCCSYYQSAKISKIFHKGTKIIVNVLFELKHKYSSHSQPKESVWQLKAFHWLHLSSCQGGPLNEFAKWWELLLSHFSDIKHSAKSKRCCSCNPSLYHCAKVTFLWWWTGTLRSRLFGKWQMWFPRL